MKAGSLIIDLRARLPWHRRYMSNTTTAILWGFWLFLWRPIVLIASYIAIEKPHLIHYFFLTFTKVIENGFTALLACAVSLWLWSNFMPSKSRKQAQAKSLSEYAEEFGLEAPQLNLLRQQKVSIVHHDMNGRITHID